MSVETKKNFSRRDPFQSVGGQSNAGQSVQGQPEREANESAEELRPYDLEADPFAPGKSVLASRLQQLKQATLHTVGRRERLPQPLFWSLFHTELKDIKRRKDKARLVRKALLGCD